MSGERSEPRLAGIEAQPLELRAAAYGELLDELQSALAAADEPPRA